MPTPEDGTPKLPRPMFCSQRIRCTRSTLRRDDNMKSLIAELSARTMTRVDIQSFLRFSASGARKYIRELKELSIITICGFVDGEPKSSTSEIFALTTDADLVEKFLSGFFKNGKTISAKSSVQSAKEQRLSMPGRTFHLLNDDEHYAVKIPRVKVFRDWGVSAIFGSGPAPSTIPDMDEPCTPTSETDAE